LILIYFLLFIQMMMVKKFLKECIHFSKNKSNIKFDIKGEKMNIYSGESDHIIISYNNKQYNITKIPDVCQKDYPRIQKSYYCKTCYSENLDAEICSVCVEKCHKGHVLSLTGKSFFYCDCETSSCLSETEKLKDKDPAEGDHEILLTDLKANLKETRKHKEEERTQELYKFVNEILNNEKPFDEAVIKFLEELEILYDGLRQTFQLYFKELSVEEFFFSKTS